MYSIVNHGVNYDHYNPYLKLRGGDAFERLLEAQTAYMVHKDYDKVDNAEALRNWASLVIFKYSMCENFDACIPYLALNYFDRIISIKIPIKNVVNDVIYNIELVALGCLSLAWRVRDINFEISVLQLEQQPDIAEWIESKISDMEGQIGKKLNLYLRVVTPFYFVPHFAPMSDSPLTFNPRTINEIIVQIQCQSDLSITKKKPSVIAASALIAASKLLYPEYHQSFLDRLIAEGFISKDEVEELVPMVIGLCKALNLAIESNVIETEAIPPSRLRVQAGNGKAGTLVSAEEPSSEMGFPIRWRLAEKYGQDYAIFSTKFGFAWPQELKDVKVTDRVVRMALENAMRNLRKAKSYRLMFARCCHCFYSHEVWPV